MTQQFWITGVSGDWSTASDWISGSVPATADDVVINNSNLASISGVVNAKSLVLNNSTLKISGNISISSSVTLNSSTINMAGGTFTALNVTGNNVIEGYGVLSSDLNFFYGSIVSDGGILTLLGSPPAVFNYVNISINSGSTIELSTAKSGVTYSGNIYFNNNSGKPSVLKFDSPSSFNGFVYNIAVNDQIDLAGVIASSASYNGSKLTINELNGQQLNYNVYGNITGNILKLVSDGNNGTLAYWGTPTIMTESLVSDTGQSSTDRITSNPSLTGTGDPNAIITIQLDGKVVSSQVIANSNGAWAYNPIGVIDGSHTVVASETDLSGNISSTTLNFTLDTTAPIVVISSQGGLTNLPTQSISGRASLTDIGTTVSILEGQKVLGSAVVQNDGSWSTSIKLSGDGQHLLTAQDIDLAGNIGSSSPLAYTLNSVVPIQKSVSASVDNHTIDVATSHTITIDLTTSAPVVVSGMPTLQLSDNKFATYVSGSGSSDLIFSYTVSAGDSSLDLAVTVLNLPNGASIHDAAGNNLAIQGGALGLQVNQPTPQATTVQLEIAGLYAAVYNRAVDSVGMSYWVGVTSQQQDASGLTQSNANTTAVSAADATSLGKFIVLAENSYYNKVYAPLNDSDFVDALYLNIGGTHAETTSAISYWVGQLQNLEKTAQNVQDARASLVGGFVQALLSTDLTQWTSILTPDQMSLAIQRQAAVYDKLTVSLAYLGASAALGGSFLNAHAVGDSAFSAEVRSLGSVTADPTSVTTALTGILNAAVHQDLSLI